MGIRMKGWSLILPLVLTSCAMAQEASSVLGGSWTATAGGHQVFRGMWSAQTSLQNPNAAGGSWTLLSEAGEVLLQGTWSARKTGQGWQGTWTARPMKAQPLSGTWTADATHLDAKSLEDVLKATAAKEIAGWWRSGRYQGNWWLNGSRQQGRR